MTTEEFDHLIDLAGKGELNPVIDRKLRALSVSPFLETGRAQLQQFRLVHHQLSLLRKDCRYRLDP